MADLVGEAYVRVTSDTTAMRRGIKAAAKQAGADWSDSWTKEVNRHAEARARSINSALARAMSDPREFDRLAKMYDSPGAAAKDFQVILKDLHKQGRMNTAMWRESSDTIQRWRVTTERANAAAAEAVHIAERDASARVIQNKQLVNFFRVQNDGYRRLMVVQRQHVNSTNAASRAATNAVASIGRSNVHWVNSARLLRVELDRTTDRGNAFAFMLGRAFGKGSRANFLNWMGSVVTGLAQVAIVIPTKAVALFTSGVANMGEAMAKAPEGMSKLASAGRGLAGVFGGKGGLIGTLAAVLIGMFAWGKAIPGIVSAMSLLGGVASSLVGTIGIGLVGALLAVVPAATAAVAGVGALAGVFVQFFRDVENKKFIADLFKPFKTLNKDYYPHVREFLTNVSTGFDDLIKDIKPSLDTFFSSFKKKMNDPSTTKALGKWSDTIGRIAKSLSDASTSFLSGITGFFVPVLPFAERLGRTIQKWGTDFDKWANSTEGQRKITTFMDKAWIAADKTARIFGNLGSIVGKIAWGGLDTGTSLMDGILGKVQELNSWLSTTEGKAKMKGWFEDAKTIGQDVGALAGDVGKVIHNLNSPEARENAKALMGALKGIGDLAVKISATADAVGNVIDQLQKPLSTTLDAQLKEVFREKTPRGTDTPKPVQPLEQRSRTSVSKQLTAFTQKIKVDVDDSLYKRKLAAIEAYQSAGVRIPVKPNDDLWRAFRGTVAQTVFAPKQIPVDADRRAWDATKGTIAAEVFDTKDVPVAANRTEWDVNYGGIQRQGFKKKVVQVGGNKSDWDRTKGTVAGYKFATKTVYIHGDESDLAGAVASAKRYLATLPANKTIRISGVNSVGGITLASGGMVYGPTRALIGEAGPEAVVPLDRPLSMVDKSVRALAAIAQGKSSFASGGVAGAPQVNILPGAIVVNSPNANPAAVAKQVIDQMAEAFR